MEEKEECYINDADTIGSLFGETYVTLSYAIYRGTWGVLRRKGGQLATAGSVDLVSYKVMLHDEV